MGQRSFGGQVQPAEQVPVEHVVLLGGAVHGTEAVRADAQVHGGVGEVGEGEGPIQHHRLVQAVQHAEAIQLHVPAIQVQPAIGYLVHGAGLHQAEARPIERQVAVGTQRTCALLHIDAAVQPAGQVEEQVSEKWLQEGEVGEADVRLRGEGAFLGQGHVRHHVHAVVPALQLGLGMYLVVPARLHQHMQHADVRPQGMQVVQPEVRFGKFTGPLHLAGKQAGGQFHAVGAGDHGGEAFQRQALDLQHGLRSGRVEPDESAPIADAEVLGAHVSGRQAQLVRGRSGPGGVRQHLLLVQPDDQRIAQALQVGGQVVRGAVGHTDLQLRAQPVVLRCEAHAQPGYVPTSPRQMGDAEVRPHVLLGTAGGEHQAGNLDAVVGEYGDVDAGIQRIGCSGIGEVHGLHFQRLQVGHQKPGEQLRTRDLGVQSQLGGRVRLERKVRAQHAHDLLRDPFPQLIGGGIGAEGELERIAVEVGRQRVGGVERLQPEVLEAELPFA